MPIYRQVKAEVSANEVSSSTELTMTTWVTLYHSPKQATLLELASTPHVCAKPADSAAKCVCSPVTGVGGRLASSLPVPSCPYQFWLQGNEDQQLGGL